MKKETFLAIIALILVAYGSFSLYSSIRLCAEGFCSALKISIPLICFTVGVGFTIWAFIIAAKRRQLTKKQQKSL